MWSVGVHGRSSAFREQQRLVFAIGGGDNEGVEAMRRQVLLEMMTQQNCRAVMVDRLGDHDALDAVRVALQQACAENELLSRTHFAVVASTPTDCALEEMAARVEQALETLQLQQLDVLLLRAQSLPGSSGIHARKQNVLGAWEHMMAIQQAGLVQHIGVSDLSGQDVDFLLTAYPDNPPEAWSIILQLPGTTANAAGLDAPLEDVTAFAHAHGIDVLVRFPFGSLDGLEPQDLRDEWAALTHNLSERYRERPFKFLVAHENEGKTASYHIDSHALSDTKVLQTPLQIVARYLLQKGLVVSPQEFYGLQRDDQDFIAEERTLREIFGPLAHPFAAIHPSCSPHTLFSSVLTRDDLAAIDRALPWATSFPLPTPPRTPVSTTGRSRPGSRQERRKNLPAVVSRPPTAD
ncbi:Alcohol dehydrogenase [NADP(+)] [Phytophthora cinnamomi]|uniref:Alcohol dehydrogenase [NADP(+)] n=1 Tax=Phytophthora cinnamomi TaxID=4785 RepID=UPI00355944EB|nr:Alcohol dehydrogenase [NADP(+)] [Phytophthora cinnamomi]